MARFFFLSLVVGLFLSVPDRTFARESLQNVHLFIVAVGKYDANDVYPPLDAAAAKAKDLADFFRSAYNLTDQQIHIYSDQTHTADEQHLLDLQKDITRIAAEDKSVVFLFVLSHGKVLHSDEYGLDLLVVASDTPGDANKPTSERVLGSGFLTSFVRIGGKSIVYAFFDTCSSGALKQIGQRFGSLYELDHKRVVSIASSGANGDSYDFSFTSALLAHWKTNTASKADCELAGNLPGKIPIPNQDLTVVLGDDVLCMNSIGPSQAMLFLVAGDAAPATVKLFDSSGHEMLPNTMVQANDFQPIFQIVSRERIQAELIDSETNNLIYRYPSVDFSVTPIWFLDLSQRYRAAYSVQSHAAGITYGMQSPIATPAPPR